MAGPARRLPAYITQTGIGCQAKRGRESTNAGFSLTAPARLDQAGILVPSLEVQVG